MSNSIDYFLTTVSPFAYLGHQELLNIAERHGKEINIRPFNLTGVWGNSGAVMPGERPLVRQRYRMLELQRVADYRGISINKKPAFFPTNPTLADHCVCASVLAGGNAIDLAGAIGKATWEQELQIADESVLTTLLGETGHDAKAILESANGEEAAALRAENTQAAIDLDAVGAPAYIYGDEVFWGQDRIEYLEHMIKSGREAFSSSL